MKSLRSMVIALTFSWPAMLSAQFAFYDSLNGLYWSQVEPPSGERFQYSQLVREGLGYMIGSSGHFYEYDDSRSQPWRRMPLPQDYTLQRYFALAPDDIWAVFEIPEIFKEALFHWNGRDWSPAFSRNVSNIRDLYFVSPEEGWLAGSFGEVWHYYHGQWEKEKTPTFIHVNRFELSPDGSLYASCEAPSQAALLKRASGEWQMVSSNFVTDFSVMTFTPSRRLLLGNYIFSAARVRLDSLEAWQVPMKSIQFLPDFGYGVDLSTIYVFQDTAFTPIVQAPVQLSEVRLFSKSFSWILGSEGMILMPRPRPATVFTKPISEQTFAAEVAPLSRVYGLALLPDKSAKSKRVYCIATEGRNVVYDFFQDQKNFEKRFFDFAPGLNLAGSAAFADRLTEYGHTFSNYDLGVTTGDLNGDGREDIIVTSMYGYPAVYFDSGHDYYFEATAYSGLKNWGDVRQRPMLANVFDADHDGDLDLFIACQFRSNAFFVNNGRGRFTEVTREANLITEGGGIGAYVADFDGDGWEDIYVTCANRGNLLYRNLGSQSADGLPRFHDVTGESGAACSPESKQSQGAALADYDNDGDIDIFVCNLVESNALLQNDGAGRFRDATRLAGLADNDQSMGAVFFDFDLDGHLDLFVSNIGANRLYKNDGRGGFIECSTYLGNFRGAANLMEGSRRLGGYSTGTLVTDVDADGDFDLIVSNYDVSLVTYRNDILRSGASLQIIPQGILSNRSAVGTKVLLYESDSLRASSKLVGMRLIESANGYGCSPEKIAHFTVSPMHSYQAKVIFPSGIVHDIYGLRSGERRVVVEVEGWAGSIMKARRALADLFLGYRSRERYLVLLLGTLLFLVLLFLGKIFLGVAVHDRPRLAAVYGVSFWACLMLWFAQSQAVFVLRPLLVSASVMILAMIALRVKRLARARPASLEMLQVRLHAFDHGSLIHQLMNRLAFYAENLQAETEISPAMRENLMQVLRNTAAILKQETGAILTYQYANNFAIDLAHELEKHWHLFRTRLAQMRRTLMNNEKLDGGVMAEIVRLQGHIRKTIAALKHRLSAEYYTDVVAVIKNLIEQRGHPGLHLEATSPLPRARIAEADFSYVLDELFNNALRHSDGRPPQIVCNVKHAYDELQIDVCDNGAGIPENLWEEIFKPGFTTKKNEKGGFGLYHIRQRVEKVGGKLFVAASTPGEGTTMRLCLKTEI